MALLTLGAIGSGLTGAVAWFSTLPPTFKYLIFLAGLTADAGVSTIVGWNEGIVGSFVTTLFAQGFQITGIVITSWQLLVIFTMLPLITFLLKNTLSHQ